MYIVVDIKGMKEDIDKLIDECKIEKIYYDADVIKPKVERNDVDVIKSISLFSEVLNDDDEIICLYLISRDSNKKPELLKYVEGGV